jgi:hypothetical protein
MDSIGRIAVAPSYQDAARIVLHHNLEATQNPITTNHRYLLVIRQTGEVSDHLQKTLLCPRFFDYWKPVFDE